jgi:hypothetical protein
MACVTPARSVRSVVTNAWRYLLDLPKCGRGCDWEVADGCPYDECVVHCDTCGLIDLRGTRYWRELVARLNWE